VRERQYFAQLNSWTSYLRGLSSQSWYRFVFLAMVFHRPDRLTFKKESMLATTKATDNELQPKHS
jgi:hypothetical protein